MPVECLEIMIHMILRMREFKNQREGRKGELTSTSLRDIPMLATDEVTHKRCTRLPMR